ncbi:MAG TPA: transcriptional regulator [Caulobacteraceae bacterium]|nr:transcriptional regulator [Caulobacteraceae bacterium]
MDGAFDPVIHAPARLQIMAVLAGVQDAEFSLLRTTVKVSDSVLSKHLAQLADAGYVNLRKAALGGRQRTWVSLTRDGRRAFASHVKALQALANITDRMAAE